MTSIHIKQNTQWARVTYFDICLPAEFRVGLLQMPLFAGFPVLPGNTPLHEGDIWQRRNLSRRICWRLLDHPITHVDIVDEQGWSPMQQFVLN